MTRSSWLTLVWGVILMVGLQAAYAAAQDELARDQTLVRELMRLEMEQALGRVRPGPTQHERARPSLHEPRSHLAMTPQLVAIYGVGQKLMAQIRVDGQTLLFIRGRREAVGAGRAHEMRLVSLTSRCVEVALQQRRDILCAPVSSTQVD